jgi:hypothetical protein
MTFFNRKEEVLNIQLTQYGKHLLSIGKFKPAYYQFFDDDVIYNIEFAGEEEKQKDIHERIKEAPRTHTQYNFVSSEDDIRKLVRTSRNRNGTDADLYVPFNMKHRVMMTPLGTAEIGEQRKPAWKVHSFRGEFEDTKTFITGTYSNLKTPRLKLEDVDYKLRVATDLGPESFSVGDTKDTVNDGKSGNVPSSNLNNFSSRFKDNTYIQVEEQYILLDLQELNTPLTQENFDLELYSVEQDEFGEEVLTQLYFNKQIEQVVNNILVDTESKLTNFTPNRKEMVESYFIFSVDKEIDTTVLCKNLSMEEKQVLVATNQLDLDCEELYSTLTDPRIVSDVKVEDLKEDC